MQQKNWAQNKKGVKPHKHKDLLVFCKSALLT